MRSLPDGSTKPYELNISYIDGLVAPDADDATRAAAMIAAHGILLAMAGLPGIYIHSLLGSRSDRAGMVATGRNRSINRAKVQAGDVRMALDDATSLRHQVFTGIARLLAARAGEPTLHPNAAQRVGAGDPAIFQIERTAPTGRRLLAAINVSGRPRRLVANAADGWDDIVSGAQIAGPEIEMPGFAVRWLVDRSTGR